jgi:lysine 2,3-aminomutase
LAPVSNFPDMRGLGMTAQPSTLRSLEALVAAHLLDDANDQRLAEVAAHYAIAVTPSMAALISDIGTDKEHDPIARQFLPTIAELDTTPDELADPIGDHAHEVVPGLVHRYPDRVLLKVTHVCPVYCRFCFRREMVGPGGEQALSPEKLDAAVAYIALQPQVFEVILTGGDPLILSPRRIAEITRRLSDIPHVQVLRWHTRVPVVAPERVTGAMIAALREADGKAVYVGLHANHVRELTPDARVAIGRMIDAGLAMVSQTVLLKGINDDADTLAQLMRAFVGLRIKPYYLHHADLAPGTGHFRTTVAEGQAIMRALRGKLSGLAQPTYVLDIPGGVAKVPVGPSYLTADGVQDPDGHVHAYRLD